MVKGKVRLIRTIIYVLAVLSGIRANARTHTELAVRDKAGPFVVLLVRAKRVAIDKTTDGVTISSWDI